MFPTHWLTDRQTDRGRHICSNRPLFLLRVGATRPEQMDVSMNAIKAAALAKLRPKALYKCDIITTIIIIIKWCRWNVSVNFPEMTGDPVFTGPVEAQHASRSCRSGFYTDFYFECQVQYRRQAVDDGARFRVSLTFDGRTDPDNPATHVITNSSALSVRFPSAALKGNIGKSVNICRISYGAERNAFYFSLLYIL